jgi:hypothetical protein
MKIIPEYLEHAIQFERMAAEATERNAQGSHVGTGEGLPEASGRAS